MSDLVPYVDPFLAVSPIDAVTGVPVVEIFPGVWTPEAKAKAIEELGIHDGRVTSGINKVIPRDCNPADCITEKRGQCPLSMKPVKSVCPYERAILETFMRGYLNELKPDPSESGTISMIRDLADTEMKIIRLNGELANAEWIREKEILDENGNIIAIEEVENVLFGTGFKLHKKKMEIMKALANTRADRMKKEDAEQGDIHRVAEVMARISKRMEAGQEVDGNLAYLPEEDKFDAWFKKNRVPEEDIVDAEYEVIEEPAVEAAE